jgi:hypothetical protein
LFSVQTVVFSLGQAVQIIGMNTQAIKALMESLTGMLDHAVATVRELHTSMMEQQQQQQGRRPLTDEQRKRQRRLRVLRWTMATALSYAVYKLIRRLSSGRRHAPIHQQGNYNPPPHPSLGYNGGGGYESGFSNSQLNPYSAQPSYGNFSSPYAPTTALPAYPQALNSYGSHGTYGVGGGYY